ncbi:hypothetical protein [Streptomyces sp. NPDC087437]|uniref:hypothetical protein n=1 Tax=Streptomyces sp. NPDC087437 TaxID=3365789 RepID=UPI003812D8C6
MLRLQIGPQPKPMQVTRVHDANGSHIEPPLDSSWGQAHKLQWQAAVVAHDTGLTIRLHPFVDPLGRVEYGITVGHISLRTLPYAHAWEALSFISTGAKALLRQQQLKEGTR